MQKDCYVHIVDPLTPTPDEESPWCATDIHILQMA